MEKILKKRFMQANGYRIFASAFIALFFSAGILFLTAGLSKGIYNMDTMTENDIQEVQVQGTIWGILDTFAEKNNSGTYDIIPYGEGSYIAVYLPKRYENKAALLMNETWEYLQGNADSIEDTFTVSGSLGSLNSDEIGLFEDYVSDYDEELQTLFLPYILRVDHIGIMSYFEVMWISLLALVFWIALIPLLVKLFTKSYLKSIKTYCKQCENGDMAYQSFERFITAGTEYGNVYMNDELIFIPEPNFKVLTREELLWIYPKRTNMMAYGVTTGQRLELAFATKKGKTYLLNYPYNDHKLTDFLSAVSEKFPEVMIGYTEELRKLFKSDRTVFAKKAYDESEDRKELFQKQKMQQEEYRNTYTGSKQYVIHEKWYTFLFGIASVLAGVLFLLGCIFFFEVASTDMLLVLFVICFFEVLGIALIINYKNRRITVEYGMVTYQTIFGRKSTYQLNKLSCKSWVNGFGTDITIYDENENKVFKYESNMVNSELLLEDLARN